MDLTIYGAWKLARLYILLTYMVVNFKKKKNLKIGYVSNEITLIIIAESCMANLSLIRNLY